MQMWDASVGTFGLALSALAVLLASQLQARALPVQFDLSIIFIPPTLLHLIG
jgi:hypothetical protein